MNLVDAVTQLGLRIAPGLAVQGFYRLEHHQGQPSIMALDRVVRPNDVVVDVGAHRGVYTWRLAQLTGLNGHVHAFEPNPPGLRVLRAATTGAYNVTTYPIALSDTTGTGRLMRPIADGRRVDAMSSLSTAGIRSDVESDYVMVRLDTLDSVLASETRRISFIKIDVEGHEHEVLVGAAERLHRDMPTLLIEIEQRHRDRPVSETFDFLLGLGYVGSVLARDRERPLADFDVQADQLAYLGDGFERGRPDPAYITDFLFKRLKAGPQRA